MQPMLVIAPIARQHLPGHRHAHLKNGSGGEPRMATWKGMESGRRVSAMIASERLSQTLRAGRAFPSAREGAGQDGDHRRKRARLAEGCTASAMPTRRGTAEVSPGAASSTAMAEDDMVDDDPITALMASLDRTLGDVMFLSDAVSELELPDLSDKGVCEFFSVPRVTESAEESGLQAG